MTRTLVVDYSRTGTTDRAASEIATALGADCERVVDHAVRRGWRGYNRCASEAWSEKLTTIDPPVHDLRSYDLVVVGTPIWCLSLSSPVRTFLREHHRELQRVAFFCTCGGHGGERVLRQMTKEAQKDPAAVLVLREAEMVAGTAAPAIRAFAAQIGRALTGVRAA